MKNKLDYQNLFKYLIDTAVCKSKELDNIKVDFNLSHNHNWCIEFLDTRNKILIKQISCLEVLELQNRIEHEWCIYDFLESTNFLPHTSSLIPKIIHFDNKKSILIYKLPNNYISFIQYQKKCQITSKRITKLIGETLAKLHFETSKNQERSILINKLSLNISHYTTPFFEYVTNYLKPESLKKVPYYSWRFLGILHSSKPVIKTITELVLKPRYYCLTHNNIKFENIFILEEQQEKKSFAQNPLKFINWETLSWGDPAYDLGKMISTYFVFWVDSMIIDSTIDMTQSIKLALISFKVINSSITTLIRTYVEHNYQILEDYPDFLIRVIKFAGLGLIEQLLTDFQFQPDKALERQNIYFYIASRLLCKPQKFLSI